jgi:hypothetical protein
MERSVKCAQCQRTNVSASDSHCDDCLRTMQSRGWRRFAEALMRGVEPDDEDRRTLH